MLDKINFKNPYSPSERFYCASGEMVRQLYKPVLKKNGIIDLEPDGVELTYEKIQSFADSVNINTIVERYAAGDMSALIGSEGTYGDFVDVPSSYMEVLNAIVEARNKYEEKEIDIPFEEYIQKLLTPGEKEEVTVQNNESEVKTDE